MGLVSFIKNLTNKKTNGISTKVVEDSYINAKESIDDYLACLERYKFLKNSDLVGISDIDLENAVMSWMWNKFNKDWSNQYEIIEALPKQCQDVYSCRTVYDEINNGGLNQLFFNSTGQFAIMAQNGFLALGARILSDIMRDSIEIFNKNKKVLAKYNDGKMESFIDSYSEELFESLDNKFYDECEKCELDKLIIRFIKEYSDCFGD